MPTLLAQSTHSCRATRPGALRLARLPFLHQAIQICANPFCLAGKYDQVRINFANPDMVGHTGDLEATRGCCALVDQCVKVST